MKKTIITLAFLCFSALLYVSCSSNDDEIITQMDTAGVGASVLIDAVNELDLKTGLSVSVSNQTAKPSETGPAICLTVSTETPNETAYPKIITVDFGSGCTSGLITRKGKLRVTLTGSVIETGSKMTIERINYSINGLLLEGTIEYTNTTSIATIPQWTTKVTNGKLTDKMGRVFLNSGIHTIKQTAGVDTPFILDDNIYEMPAGNHSVLTDKGITLTLTVQETLIKKYSCEYISKGKLKIQGGDLNGVVDYGNNECDTRYIYTHESGTSYELAM